MTSQELIPQVSFIIPVYNEELNITGVFRDLYQSLEAHRDWRWEVIVIEDGSQDRTREVIQGLAKQYPETQLILHDKNMGYNQSMRDGFRKARGKYFMYVGADEEFDCSEIPSFVAPLLAKGDEHADVVLGVRWQRNAYKLHRFFLSVIYIFLLNFLFKLRVNDYNWSQAWKSDLIRNIDIQSKSLFMLPEIIIKAYDLGLKVKEVPSNHRGRKWGKSSLNMRIMSHALLDAFRFLSLRKSRDYRPSVKPAIVPHTEEPVTISR
ncbi:MAG: glycosyltransferase family 2 protein [Candidatus Omnitrophota bacterium]|nr:glycosyltransferase family 2 protein [Candidatus Omnitrophota bacterium]